MRQDEIGRERDKRILDPNSAHTRPGGENCKKKNSKKIQKFTEHLFFIILSQIGMRQAKKDRKEFQTRIPLILDPGEKIPKKKNSKQILKIIKQLSGVIFSQNGMRQDEINRERDKRILDQNSTHTRPGEKIPKKKQQKNFKN